jgi:hypothetical protein
MGAPKRQGRVATYSYSLATHGVHGGVAVANRLSSAGHVKPVRFVQLTFMTWSHGPSRLVP